MVLRGGRRRGWGQHFLVDRRIRDRIVEEANLSCEDVVVEIGVGEGFLTEPLLQRAGWVVGFEVDPVLVHLVKEKLAAYSHFSLYPGDFLKIDLKACLTSLPLFRKKCVSNLPYSISTPALLKLLTEDVTWNLLLLMVQREFGERVLALPPQGKGTFLSVVAHLRFEVQKVLSVSPSAFRPNPRVESVVLKFLPRDDRVDLVTFRKVTALARFCFSQKRKSLLSLLGMKSGNCDRVLAMIQAAGISPRLRAEDLERSQWIALAEILTKEDAFLFGENAK